MMVRTTLGTSLLTAGERLPLLFLSAHGIKVIIDLHAASGSQNGQEHSSSCNGISEWAKQGGTDYLYESIMATEFLASRYTNNQSLLGIELLNEPSAEMVPFDVLEYYYKWSYSVIRNHTASAYMIMCQCIRGDWTEFVNVLPADNVVLNVHLYNLFNLDLFGMTTAQWNIDFVYNDQLSLLQKLNMAGNALIFVESEQMNGRFKLHPKMIIRSLGSSTAGVWPSDLWLGLLDI
ncbi:probable glucan 1,3-beta-glucosidase A [Physcomitrium patens]|uniref:probable glucan 1,3-beta-glucosidase A n=1 Tax=Physcomitrium patens TaxID=3218 RepID=UPI000D155294|nr:glucan 1,3-beta-glucosidase-like [Physcomitrium patens]XP_024388191.1 glucan 1,3-beta-glucosidase-like [Physcomitrium patens]XP_024388192.1 glucan 1,3-beta-glucosidase-like [Physcomitrium patens]|eukprot:XP_024388190.1 glucan 1,3-beta-glucosidase-like [Physcomitrella patens]